MNPWTVRVLGTVAVDNGETVIERFATKRSTHLLIRLALGQGRAISRDVICQEMWPDEFFDVTRIRLRQELKRLRKSLGPARGIVFADRMSLRIDTAHVEIDLRSAERLISLAATKSGEARVKVLQDFAPFAAELAPGYSESWLAPIQEDWRSRASRKLLELSEILANAGDSIHALGFARKAALLNLFSESVQASYMDLLLKSGRPKEVDSHLHELNKAYRSALGAGPSQALLNTFSQGVSPALDAPELTVPVQQPFPAALSELVGREPEVLKIVEMIAPGSQDRLVILTGPGGIGKTQLALAAGRKLYRDYRCRLWFVPLSDVEDAEFLAASICESLGITAFGDEPLGTAARALSGEPALLILDNLEQLADGGGQIARKLLERCENLKLLITSRRKLRIEGEKELVVPPLTGPHAVELYCQDARGARPSFEASAEEMEQIKALVDLLDRMPLAIRLASSRARVLTPSEMLAQLSRRFELLVSRSTDIEPRHRALRQTIAWSFEHLSEPARQFLLDLSVFRGGWTLSLAEEVLKRKDSVSLLEELSENSFIYEFTTEDGMRFNMLHSIREFAEERQDEGAAKEHLQSLSRALWDLCQVASDRYWLHDQMIWYRRVGAEYENIRKVLLYLVHNDHKLGIEFCAVIWRFWTLKGYHAEAKGWYEPLLAEDTAPSRSLGIAMFGAGISTLEQGSLGDAEKWLRRAAAIFDQVGGSLYFVACNINLAEIHMFRHDLETAEKLLLACVAQTRELKNLYNEGVALDSLATVYLEMNRLEEAQKFLELALESLSRCEDRIAVANARITKGRLEMKYGRYEAAAQELASAVQSLTEFGNQRGLGAAKQCLAELSLFQNQLDEAIHFCAESAKERTAIGDLLGLGHIYLILAETMKRKGDNNQALEYAAEARRHFRACDCEALFDLDPYAQLRD